MWCQWMEGDKACQLNLNLWYRALACHQGPTGPSHLLLDFKMTCVFCHHQCRHTHTHTGLPGFYSKSSISTWFNLESVTVTYSM